MSAPVPEKRIVALDSGVLVGRSVRSVHWITPSRLNNWLAGRGQPLVPAHVPGVTIGASDASEFHYRVRPRYQNTRLRFSVLLTAETLTTARLEIPVGTAAGSTFTVHNRRRAVQAVRDVDLSAQADEETTLSLKIENLGGSLVVEGIAIEALPRGFLTAASPNDLGSNRLQFWHGRPISERNFGYHLFDLQSALKRSARRSLFQHSWGSDAPWNTSAGGPTNVFDDKFGLIGRYLYDGDTTRECSWRIRGYCSDGTTSADVTLTNTGAGAANTTIEIPAGTTSPGWFPPLTSDRDTFECDAEDTSHAWGLRGSAVDEHQIAVTRTAGAGTIYLETVSIWESPDAAPPPPTSYRITDASDPRITDASDLRIID